MAAAAPAVGSRFGGSSTMPILILLPCAKAHVVEMINAVAADVRNRTMWPSRESSEGHRSAARLGLASVLVVLRPACCAFWGNWDRRKAAHTVAELSFPTRPNRNERLTL